MDTLDAMNVKVSIEAHHDNIASIASITSTACSPSTIHQGLRGGFHDTNITCSVQQPELSPLTAEEFLLAAFETLNIENSQVMSISSTDKMNPRDEVQTLNDQLSLEQSSQTTSTRSSSSRSTLGDISGKSLNSKIQAHYYKGHESHMSSKSHSRSPRGVFTARPPPPPPPPPPRRSRRLAIKESDPIPKSPGRICSPRHTYLLPTRPCLKSSFPRPNGCSPGKFNPGFYTKQQLEQFLNPVSCEVSETQPKSKPTPPPRRKRPVRHVKRTKRVVWAHSLEW